MEEDKRQHKREDSGEEGDNVAHLRSWATAQLYKPQAPPPIPGL